MTLAELIRRFRTMANDRVQPYFCSDEDVKDWLNDAQDQACVRGRLLRDDSTPDVCQIVLTPGQPVYPLHRRLYEIISLRVKDADGKARPMRLVSREWLDAEFTRLECEPLRPTGKLLLADKVVVLARDAGAVRLADPAWGPQFAAAAAAALAKPTALIDAQAMSVSF